MKLRLKIEMTLGKYALSFAPTEKQYGIFMEEAVDQILKEVKGCVPKEKKIGLKEDPWDDYEDAGYNQCRKDFLKNLE